MLRAKLAMPFPSTTGPVQPALEHALVGSTTLFSAPAGYFLTRRLSALLQERQIASLWLRSTTQERDPAILLSALGAGADGIFPGLAARSLDRMRRRPGPIYGWAPLYSALARDISEASAERGSNGSDPTLALVVQHLDTLYPSPATLSLIYDIFLPLLPVNSSCILTSHTLPPRGSLPGYIIQHSLNDLRLDEREALLLAQGNVISSQRSAASPSPSLPISSLRRLVALVEGCGSALSGLYQVYPLLGGNMLQRLVEAATSRVDLMARVAKCCMQTGPVRTTERAALALHLNYLTPDLIHFALGEALSGSAELPPDWLQPLEGGWMRLGCVWQEPLQQAISPAEHNNRVALKRAAQFLLEAGDAEQAIPLMLELGSLEEAAQAILQVAESMIDHGVWDTLSAWLDHLPVAVRRAYPWLIFAEGELAAANGQSRKARHIFSTATKTFQDRKDARGEAQSLINESVLAARQNDLVEARHLAQQAQALAQQAGLPWQQGWSYWQLGCLAAASGQLSEAAAYFRAARDAGSGSGLILTDSHPSGAIPTTGQSETAGSLALSHQPEPLSELIEQAQYLALELVKLQQQIQEHHRAAQAATQASRDAAERLRFFLQDPGGPAINLLGQYGWSKLPLSISMPASYAPQQPITLTSEESSPNAAVRLLALVRGLLQSNQSSDIEKSFNADGASHPSPSAQSLDETRPAFIRKAQEPAPEKTQETVYPLINPDKSLVTTILTANVAAEEKEPQVEDSQPKFVKLFKNTDQSLASHDSSQPADRDEPSHLAPILPEAHSPSAPLLDQNPARHTLNAYLLGSFRVTLDEIVISNWPGERGRQVFAYLLAQHRQPTQREQLMETFWPDAEPDSARNSLNVAIYSLRRALKEAIDFPVVLFHENTYLLNSDLTVWIDMDEFEALVHSARIHEARGDAQDALHQYEQAASLYQGDFLADSPYEEWTALERERLRVLYLDTLDHLSLIYFNRGQYAASVSLCQQLLSQDACREDAHCRLMRCYMRQGQVHLALRQYQACVEALQDELEVNPSAATTLLYEQIRRREAV